MRRVFLMRISLYLLAFFVPVLVLSGFTLLTSMADLYSPSPTFEGARTAPLQHDPTKPTVAVLLGGDGTEVTDFLVPYELFSRSARFNVYAVAPEMEPSPLTSGLDVLPQHNYESLGRLLSGNPEVIVVPAMVDSRSAANQPVIAWLKDNAGPKTLILSICSGAAVLAETGLLDGHTATSHWGDLATWARRYPKVNWVRGQRYVDEGTLITTAGLTSSVDGVLHVLDRLVGRDVATRVAEDVHYENLQFLDDPDYFERHAEPADSIFYLNAAFRPIKPELGVLLYNGLGEMPLASVIDTYGATLSAHMRTLTPRGEAVKSQHGLTFVPRWSFADAPKIKRLLVPGKGTLAAEVKAWAQEGGVKVEHLHEGTAGSLSRFAFDAPVADLGGWANLPIARFAAKRLELLSVNLPMEGKGWPLHLFLLPLMLGTGGIGIVAALDRRVLLRFRRTARRGTYAVHPRRLL